MIEPRGFVLLYTLSVHGSVSGSYEVYDGFGASYPSTVSAKFCNRNELSYGIVLIVKISLNLDTFVRLYEQRSSNFVAWGFADCNWLPKQLYHRVASTLCYAAGQTK